MKQYFNKETEVETIAQIITKLLKAQIKLDTERISDREYNELIKEIWKEFYSNTEYR